MAVKQLLIQRREPYEDGRAFGTAGPYERIDAHVFYAVDPDEAANSTTIVDLDRAERGPDGLVRFDGDVTVLVPADRGRANGTLLLEVPNRGNRLALRSFNRAPVELEPTERIHPGDGFLLNRGWTLAWCGWQWDVPRSPARMGLTVPQALGGDGRPLVGPVMLRFQPNTPCTDVVLTDQHVGSIGGHLPVPAADPEDVTAVLLVRDTPYGEAAVVPRASWRFARQEGTSVTRDPERIWLSGGFEPGRIYDVVYRSGTAPVVGCGLLAVRDLASYLRFDATANNPLAAGGARTVIGEGQSQCGRFLRTLLHLGLDVDEAGCSVFDGVLVHIAGGRRGEFNHRFAQPSVQPTPSFGHLFPFADAAQVDPASGVSDGILVGPLARDAPPKVIYTDSASEYWRGDAFLAHSSAEDGTDVTPPASSRRYLFASTQHGPGGLPFNAVAVHGSKGANNFNIVDYTPLFRAALLNLQAWVVDGVEPPPNQIPSHSAGTAAARSDVLAQLAGVATLALADPALLPRLFPLDLGPEAHRGVGSYPAAIRGAAYPSAVSAVDRCGNEVAGVRMPDVSVPVATHTGWNPRLDDSGGRGQLLEYLGSSVPLPRTAAQDEAAGDPRPSLDALYCDRDDYATQVRVAAEALVAERLLLAEDVELCVKIAVRRYDAVALPG